MEHATQVALTKDIFRHLEAGTTCRTNSFTTNPVSAYASLARLKREQDTLFREHPLLIGLSCQLPDPGDCLTDDFSGVPILVIRTDDGGISAFLNVCSHRGARLVEGSGRLGRNFSCPYHAWTYDRAGKLAVIPDEDSFGGLDRSRCGLKCLPVVEEYGLIWVRPKPGDAIDLDAHLGGLGVDLKSYHLDAYHHYETRLLRHEMNWKLAIDTFLEPYHFGSLHKNTVGPIFFPNLCLFHPFGDNLREVLPRRSLMELADKPEAEWDLIKHTAIVYVLFPNTVLVMQADHVEIWRVFPVADRVDQCVLHLDFYIPEPATSDQARRHWDRNMDLTIRTVIEEDFVACEGMQVGFRSGARDHVIYGRNEPALAYFQNAITAALK